MSTAPSPVGVAVSAEVEAALASGGAVVALESTIISHGTPRSPSEQSRQQRNLLYGVVPLAAPDP
jgi:pseudouridine-5'-phosphate glycosidase